MIPFSSRQCHFSIHCLCRWILLPGEISSGSVELVQGSEMRCFFFFPLDPLKKGSITRLMLLHVDHMGPYTILFSCVSPTMLNLYLICDLFNLHQFLGMRIRFTRFWFFFWGKQGPSTLSSTLAWTFTSWGIHPEHDFCFSWICFIHVFKITSI